MEINSASPSAYKNTYDRPISISNSTEGGDGNINVYVVMPDTVQISPEAAARAYAADSDDAGDDDGADSADGADGAEGADNAEASAKPADADAPDAPKAADSKDTEDSKSVEDSKEPSTPKSFVYGALGLERPEKSEGKPSDGYDFGRWLAASVTIGTIISVLV